MTWKDFDVKKVPCEQIFKKYSLADNSVDFVGHALALHVNDDYLKEPAAETLAKIQLYMESMGKYGDSPFLYPLYGLGGLPESFSRLCAIHGGTYMLNTAVDEIMFENGAVCGVRVGNDVAKAPLVICDPTYVKEQKRTRVAGRVIRAICILDHPIPNTGDVASIQIILPQKQLNRKSDVYITMVSFAHAVCAKDLYIAIISATVETSNPEAEIAPAKELLGSIREMFISVSDLHEPINDWQKENLFITKSYDATSHFETSDIDVLSIYERIVGEKLDLNV